MLYILEPIWLMTRVVTDSCNMESNVYTQTLHQSLSPNLPYSHTNLVSCSMFISVNYQIKLNLSSLIFFTWTKFVPVKENPKAFQTTLELAFTIYLRLLSQFSQNFCALCWILNDYSMSEKFGLCSLDCIVFYPPT